MVIVVLKVEKCQYIKFICMKKNIAFILFGIVMILPSQLMAQSLSAKAAAEIVAPLVIVDNSGLAGGTTLDFGKITVSATGGACVVSTTNVRSVTGGITAVSSSTTSTASFSIAGKVGATYGITLPAADIALTRTTGTETMTVGSFVARPASSVAGDALVGTLDATGSDTFTVGGTLTVGVAQAEGVYVGTFNVTAAYN
jgi:hypothetical protein